MKVIVDSDVKTNEFVFSLLIIVSSYTCMCGEWMGSEWMPPGGRL
jgi:hypothetical protein